MTDHDRPVIITAYGTPATQGSKRHVGKGIMVEASTRTRPWRETVKYAALEAMDGRHRIETAVAIAAIFAFDRPRAHHRTGIHAAELRPGAPLFPSTRNSGDLDKLLRCVCDAIVDGGVIRDDSLIVLVNARKVWAGWTLAIPGVRLIVKALP